MADDKGNRGPADRARVNVNEDYEVRYWTHKFSCSEEHLRDAVRAVGASANAVERWIASH